MFVTTPVTTYPYLSKDNFLVMEYINKIIISKVAIPCLLYDKACLVDIPLSRVWYLQKCPNQIKDILKTFNSLLYNSLFN